MNVKQLREALEAFPDDIKVVASTRDNFYATLKSPLTEAVLRITGFDLERTSLPEGLQEMWNNISLDSAEGEAFVKVLVLTPDGDEPTRQHTDLSEAEAAIPYLFDRGKSHFLFLQAALADTSTGTVQQQPEPLTRAWNRFSLGYAVSNKDLAAMATQVEAALPYIRSKAYLFHMATQEADRALEEIRSIQQERSKVQA